MANMGSISVVALTDGTYDIKDSTARDDIETLTSDKQDKNDETLNTEAKTVSGAINELKASMDQQNVVIKSTIDDCVASTDDNDVAGASAVAELKVIADDKQDASDSSLNTTAKTVSGAINELKATIDSKSDEDTKVTQTAVGSDYTNYRPLLIGASNNATEGFTPTTTTDGAFATSALYCRPSSGLLGVGSLKVNKKVSIQYNSTNQCIDFVFS